MIKYIEILFFRKKRTIITLTLPKLHLINHSIIILIQLLIQTTRIEKMILPQIKNMSQTILAILIKIIILNNRRLVFAKRYK
jgi:hypothetical protein